MPLTVTNQLSTTIALERPFTQAHSLTHQADDLGALAPIRLPS
jgi:hypothetical protein